MKNDYRARLISRPTSPSGQNLSLLLILVMCLAPSASLAVDRLWVGYTTGCEVLTDQAASFHGQHWTGFVNPGPLDVAILDANAPELDPSRFLPRTLKVGSYTERYVGICSDTTIPGEPVDILGLDVVDGEFEIDLGGEFFTTGSLDIQSDGALALSGPSENARLIVNGALSVQGALVVDVPDVFPARIEIDVSPVAPTASVTGSVDLVGYDVLFRPDSGLEIRDGGRLTQHESQIHSTGAEVAIGSSGFGEWISRENFTVVDSVSVGGSLQSPGGLGRLEVDDANFNIARLLRVWQGGTVEVISDGIDVGTSFFPPFPRALTVGSAGELLIDGGRVEVPAGTLRSLDGTIRVTGGGEINLGIDAFPFSDAISIGQTTNRNGTPSLFAEGTVEGSVFSDGRVGIGALEGTAAELIVDGFYLSGPTASFEIDLGGSLPGETFDVMEVSGLTNLAGTLSVGLIDGFEATVGAGDAFVVLRAAGGLSGTFSNAPNGAWIPFSSASSSPGAIRVRYVSGQVVLDRVIVPEPTGSLPVIAGTIALGFSARRRGSKRRFDRSG